MPPENSSQPNNLPAAYNRTRIFIAIAALIVVGLGGIMLITSDKNPLPHSNSARIKRATAKQAALYKEKEGVPLSELKQNCLQDVSAPETFLPIWPRILIPNLKSASLIILKVVFCP
jgi:hypothetical protein